MLVRMLAVPVLCAALAFPAAAADYALDPAHTQAQFTVVHLAISHVSGQIPLISGTMSTNAGGVPEQITATLSVKDLDTHDADRDRDLRSPDWFDVAKFPTMTFVARKVDGTPKQFTVTGDLTFHGVTKPVVLAATETGRMTDGRGRTHIGYTVTTTIDRREWGLNWGKTTPGGALIAGDDVTISLNVEAVSK
jgi:polyisoprenoid-binding protein YceI